MPRSITREDLGWNAAHQDQFAPYAAQGWHPARLLRDNKISYGCLVFTPGDFDEVNCILSGRVYHEAETDAELPAVGDWVALDLSIPGEAIIRARLPRQTCFSRKAPGNSTEEQVLVANVDSVIVVSEPGADLNPRRLERYHTLIQRSGAKPIIVLNKTDLYTKKENAEALAIVEELLPGVPVHLTSVLENKGIRALKAYFKRGLTIALIGSSGVGKSAMVNELIGDEWQWVGDVNETTGKGRHTTTARELILLPKGGILVDNPGIKEVQMWTDETTLREAFTDLEELTTQCRFQNCKHRSDAGCALRAALEGGTLDEARLQGFLRLEDEISQLKKRQKKRQMTVERIAKRDHKIKARNPADRKEIQNHLKPRI